MVLPAKQVLQLALVPLIHRYLFCDMGQCPGIEDAQETADE